MTCFKRIKWDKNQTKVFWKKFQHHVRLMNLSLVVYVGRRSILPSGGIRIFLISSQSRIGLKSILSMSRLDSGPDNYATRVRYHSATFATHPVYLSGSFWQTLLENFENVWFYATQVRYHYATFQLTRASTRTLHFRPNEITWKFWKLWIFGYGGYGAQRLILLFWLVNNNINLWFINQYT